MGLGVFLQEEDWVTVESVYDPKMLLNALLRRLGEESHPFLSTVDFYGNTVFNGMQVKRFLKESGRV